MNEFENNEYNDSNINDSNIIDSNINDSGISDNNAANAANTANTANAAGAAPSGDARADGGYPRFENTADPNRGGYTPSFDRPNADAFRPGFERPAAPRGYSDNAPDYRAAYGQTYDPYDGRRPDANAGGYRPRYEQQPGVHTYVNGGQRDHYDAPYGYGEINREDKKKEKKQRNKKGYSGRAMAWMIALCIMLSAVFGAGGVYVGSKLVGSNSTSKEYGTINYEKGESTITPDGSIAAAAAIAADSVVEITTEKMTTSAFFGQFVQSGAGSGVVISEDGRIITCAHVVEGATSVTVRLTNGDSFEAKVLGSDSRTDIAVIKIDATGLVAAKIGDSDKVVVGQSAIAIGNPLGTLGGTVTSGIISTLNREITIDGQNYTLLQLDASINPGNSGGGLFDINGNLIGIVNAKSGSAGSSTTIEGLGFAIPINQAIDVASQLSDQGYVGGRVNLGIYVVEVNESTSTTDLYNNGYSDLINYITDYGVYFLKYQAGQNGDFKYGDRIIAIDGTSVSSRSDVLDILEDHEIGDTVTVTVSRMNTDMRRAQMVEVSVNLVEYMPETTSADN